MEVIVVKTKDIKKKTKKIKVEALGNRVLLRRDDPEAITEGGIILAAGAQEHPLEAEIFGVGDDCLNLKVGDKVLVPPHAGTSVVLRGTAFIIMSEDEVMVRIHEGD
jgi:co-chaperonin GroES (HSP10)